MLPKKILIIGISGTGKTTVGKYLSSVLSIPFYPLDSFIWKPKWVEAPQHELIQNVNNIIGNDRWIIEGYINPLGKEKLIAANIVIYLDYSGLSAVWGGIRRWWQNKGKVRQEMPEGCVETLDLKYLLVMYKRMERFEIEETIKGYEMKIIRLQSARELKTFLDKFCSQEIL